LAQDAIQEVFLRYFKTRRDGGTVNNPRAWLFHVLRNYMLDQIRENSSMKPVGLGVLDNTADIKQNIETTYEQSEAFQQAVSVLAPRERECVQLHLEGFGYAEIAQILQIRTRSVGALLTRSLNKIRRTGIFSGK
jgi:RNA polymerase sigma-70 factor (ECF subfamily)